jgi:trehalose 6-phosphate synthase/phosphatase
MTDRTPGSFIEAKRYGFAWHYRLADPEFGAFVARELVSLLEQQLAGTDLVVLAGRKVVEVRHAWATKGEAAWAIRGRGPAPDFELAIGDDRTDEDLFERLPAGAWTIHVGRGPSRARHRLPDPQAVVALLDALATRPRPSPAPRTTTAAASRRRRARRRGDRAGARSRPTPGPQPRASRRGSRSP